MRIVNIEGHLEGKRLAKTIYSAEGRILLKKGVTLTPSYLRLLKAKGYSSVYIENELLPGLHIDEVINESTRVKATVLVKQAIDGLKRGEDFTLEPINRAVDSILEDLAYNSEMVVQLSTLRSIDEYSFVHSVNVSVMSMLVGQALHYPQRDLKHLGVGAMLHDLGKVRIPLEFLKRQGPLSPSEYKRVKDHTTEGFDILRRNREVSILSAHIAFQHHERMDGSGYPRGLSGHDILEFARIACVADVYDALVSDRPYRERFSPDVAMQELRQGMGRLFDKNCVRHLMMRLAVYPVGTIVLLSNRHIAVVTEQGSRPDRPILAVVTDDHLDVIPPYPLSLDEAADISITKTLTDYPPSVLRQVRQGHQDSFFAASGYWRT